MHRVLCVDDNADLVEALTDILMAMKFDARSVTSGNECLELLASGKFRPDVILLDIMMSPMDGWSTLRHIRSESEISCIPVIMLTGKYPTPSEINDFSPLFDGYLMKPFAFERLKVELEKVVGCFMQTEVELQDARKKGVCEPTLCEYRRLTSAVRVMSEMQNNFAEDESIKEACCAIEKQMRSRVIDIMGNGRT
ncbi:MAG: response regulator PleD [Methanomassiliicoccales archaeon PtaU1.Bin124]|nr:MAG: response regulator PleD [Methanomassiliicoccales archaeon PtaU1.Bin124]